jgi:hypothetical protein
VNAIRLSDEAATVPRRVKLTIVPDDTDLPAEGPGVDRPIIQNKMNETKHQPQNRHILKVLLHQGDKEGQVIFVDHLISLKMKRPGVTAV